MIVGLIPFVVILVAATPWWLVLNRRIGGSLALAAVMAAAGLLVIGVLALCPLVAAPAGPALLVVFTALLILGLVVSRRQHGVAPARATVVVGLAAGTGAGVWVGGLMLAHLVPGSDVISWTMNGDAANNLMQARLHLAAGGLELGTAVSIAVPFTSLLLSVALWPGRPAEGESAQLAHDLIATSAFWSVEVIVASILIGVVASSMVPRYRALAAGAFSLLGLTWLVIGLPLESGYLNTLIGVSLLLLSWIAYRGSGSSVPVSLTTQCAVILLTMATWTPLAIVPSALLLLTAARHRASLRVAPIATLAAPLATATATVVWVGLVVVPSFLGNSLALSIAGNGFPATFVLLGVALAACIGFSSLLSDSIVRSGALAIAIAMVLGMAVMLFFAGRESDPLSAYYPAKLSWLFALFAIVIGVSLVLGVIARSARRVLAPAIVGLAALGIVLASLGPAPARAVPDLAPPLVSILGGSVWSDGDESASMIIEHVGQQVVLYRTDRADEAFINHWLLTIGSTTVDQTWTTRKWAVWGFRELRDTSSYNPPPIEELCALVDALGPDAVVITADPSVRMSLAAECIGQQPLVRMDEN